MGIKSEAFRAGDVYIDYPYESVMFRYEKATEKVFRKFYGESETEIHYTSKLYRDAELAGTQITAEQYARGKSDLKRGS